jgi:hypothetical protein
MLSKRFYSLILWTSIFVFSSLILLVFSYPGKSNNADAAQACMPTNLRPNSSTFFDSSKPATLSWSAVAGAIGYNVRLNSLLPEKFEDSRYENCQLGNTIEDLTNNYYCVRNVQGTSITDIPLLPILWNLSSQSLDRIVHLKLRL